MWRDAETDLPVAVVGEINAPPIISADVLCYCDDTQYFVGNYDHEDGCWYWNEVGPIRAGVKLWMPLPEPPK